MHLKLIRNTFTDLTTIGELYINGSFFCYTLEDVDKNLYQNNSLLKIKSHNLFSPSAIPYGVYKLEISLKPNLGKLLPKVMNVKGFKNVFFDKNVLINKTSGTIMLGHKKANNALFNYHAIENELVDLLITEEDSTLEITSENKLLDKFKKTYGYNV